MKIQIENEINQSFTQQGFQLTTPFYYLQKHKYIFNDNSVDVTKQIIMTPIFMYFCNSSFVLGTNEKIEFEELTINFKQEENIEKLDYLQTDLTFNINSGVKSYIYIVHKSKSCSSVMEHEDLLNLLMAMRTCLKNKASKTHKEDIEKLVIYGGLVASFKI